MKKEKIIEAMKTLPHFSLRLSKKIRKCEAYVSQVKSGAKKMPESWLPFADEVIKEMYAELDRVSGKVKK